MTSAGAAIAKASSSVFRGVIVPWAPPWRSLIREIRERFKVKAFFRDHYVFGTKIRRNRDRFRVRNSFSREDLLFKTKITKFETDSK